jgi:hypothetical protein
VGTGVVAERACASFSARIFASVSVFTSRSVSSSCDARWFASAIAFFALSRVLSRSRSALATRLAASWRILVTASSISVTARAAKAFASSSAACASTAASDANLFSAAAAASTSPPCSVSMYCDPVNPPPSPDNPSPKTPPRASASPSSSAASRFASSRAALTRAATLRMMSSSFFAAAPSPSARAIRRLGGRFDACFRRIDGFRAAGTGAPLGAPARSRRDVEMGDGDRARAPGVDARRADAPSAPNPARALALAIDDAAIPRQPPARRLPRREEKPSSFFKRRSGRPIDRSSKTTTRYDPSAGVFASRARPLSVRDPVVRAPRLSRARAGVFASRARVTRRD